MHDDGQNAYAEGRVVLVNVCLRQKVGGRLGRGGNFARSTMCASDNTKTKGSSTFE
jgi:hypothetical protein